MPAQIVKNVISGAVATFIGGIVLFWIFRVGPFQEKPQDDLDNDLVENIEEAQEKLNINFSFHSPVLKFYKGSKEVIPLNQRTYTTEFTAGKVNYINWELTLKHAPLPEKTPLNLFIVYRKLDGEQITTKNYESFAGKGWESSIYTWGWGSADDNYWKPGNYILEIFYKGNLLTSGSFVVK
jgi:hypothetical protein